MSNKPLMAFCAIFAASVALAFISPRANSASDPTAAPEAAPEAEPSQVETPVTVSWSKGSDDGSAVFHLTIYAPWGDATQRTVAFYTGFVSRSGLAGLEGTRVSEACLSGDPLESVGDRFKCTARLNQVANWSEVQTVRDVTLTVTAIE